MARGRRGYGGGRERFGGARGNVPRPRFGPRDEDPPPPRRASGWGVAPPSRHLWVGGLAPGVTASDLLELFLRCGDVEDIARDPGRSFAFVSFLREEDAIAAMRELQGTRLGGAPVRIEFSKGDKASGSSMDDRYMQYADERHSIVHGREQQPSPEKTIDKSKRNRSTEPSEVLWIGFPHGLKVDEAALWEAFLPFGEILRITTFPGRTYAFVQYTSISAACRAKKALQGKLFSNPQVSICFSRNEGVAEVGKHTCVPPYSPQSSARHIYEQDFEAFPRARPFDSPPRDFRMPSPQYGPNRLLREADDVSFRRNNYFHQESEIDLGPVSNNEPFRIREPHSDRRMPEEFYEQLRQSPSVRSDAPWHNVPIERPRRPFPLGDHWDVEDDSYPVTKKLRGGQVLDAELPEHPFSEFRPGKFYPDYLRRPLNDLPEDDLHTRTYQFTHIHYRHQNDLLRNQVPLVDKHAPWHVHDSSARHLGDLDRLTPEHHEPALKEEWSWNGTIAKGGTPICRARCFPVGKVLNFMLTNLDMLAKHYYQAAASWVVFFVPENDADMTAYNEFMNYLGDKQRAAVCQLGERSTLFLVPPSDFSEQVLRVPGKVSISGVILKFLQSNPDYSSPSGKSLEKGPASSASHLKADVSSHDDMDLLRRLNPPDIRTLPQFPDYISSSAGSYNPANTDFVPPYKPESAPLYADSQLPQERPPADSHMGGIVHYKHQQLRNVLPGWSNNTSELGPDSVNFSSLAQNAMSHVYNRTLEPKGTASIYAPGEASNSMSWPPAQPKSQEVTRPNQPLLPVSLPQDQLAQLTALLSQQNQPEKEVPMDSSNKQFGLQNSNPHGHCAVPMMTCSSTGSGPIPIQNSLLPVPPSMPQLQVPVPPIQGSQPPNSSISNTTFAIPPMHALVCPPHSSVPLGSFVPPLPEGAPSYQQHTSSAPTVQPPVPSGQQLTSQEELDGDPQMRLQATLQLAATLLKQIQQQSNPGTKK
ncbi:hypothetical protein PR202_gb22897 [Eleusine coracana subsp. coracana]|uniref:RRM domain-containing protein n=1 Tax=Eleusine coracana subsp. coracana TaxID=191504 RepID=A0AAV5FGZ5_ELECO|nr:hypothetical protein PR202_gb22897 [Eleusine coracana subsp. coracana]